MRFPNQTKVNMAVAKNHGAEKVCEWSLLAGKIMRHVLALNDGPITEDQFWQEIRSCLISHYDKKPEENPRNRTRTTRRSFKEKALAKNERWYRCG